MKLYIVPKRNIKCAQMKIPIIKRELDEESGDPGPFSGCHIQGHVASDPPWATVSLSAKWAPGPKAASEVPSKLEIS